jgi:hypothetical protein
LFLGFLSEPEDLRQYASPERWLISSGLYGVIFKIIGYCTNKLMEKILESDIGFEVLTPVVMNSSVFWVIAPCVVR